MKPSERLKKRIEKETGKQVLSIHSNGRLNQYNRMVGTFVWYALVKPGNAIGSRYPMKECLKSKSWVFVKNSPIDVEIIP